MYRRARLGLIGGLGVAAGVHYYRRLAEAVRHSHHSFEILLAHADIETMFRLSSLPDGDAVVEYLTSIISPLCRADCSAIAIAAVTPHRYIDRLARRCPLPILSVVTALNEYLATMEFRRVSILGTRYVMETGLFGALGNVKIVPPHESERDLFDRVYTAMAVRGYGTEEECDLLLKLADGIVDRQQVDAVVLAATDISAILGGRKLSPRIVDAAEIHISSIVMTMAT